jgi:hypothetical protein
MVRFLWRKIKQLNLHGEEKKKKEKPKQNTWTKVINVDNGILLFASYHRQVPPMPPGRAPRLGHGRLPDP